MGRAKEQLIEIQEERTAKHLASTLGISSDELNRLHYAIYPNESDDGLVYGYRIEFNVDSEEEILNKVKNLEDGRVVYLSPWEFSRDLEEEELEWEIESTEQLKIFNRHLKGVANLLVTNVDEETQFDLLVMLQVHIVAAIESFLSSTFIHVVTNSNELTRKLVETDPEFADRKISFNEIFQQHDNLRLTTASYLKSLIFHNLNKVKPMYKSVLDFDFGNVSWLFQAINLRHDCAHRAGFDKEGNRVNISIESIRELMRKCTELSSSIDAHIVGFTRK